MSTTGALAPLRPTPITIAQISDFYSVNTPGQQFIYNGRTYRADLDNGNLKAVETGHGEGWRKFFGTVGQAKREAQVSELLVRPESRRFLVDVDKTLLYRQNLEDFPLNNGYPAGVVETDRSKFTPAVLWRKDRPVRVLLNNQMLAFLSNQKKSGAEICITSSGGWQDQYPANLGNGPGDVLTIRDLLNSEKLPECHRFEISGFDNKKTLDSKLKWYDRLRLAGFGLFEKYRVFGNATTKTDNGVMQTWKNIMIDDQTHQRCKFLRAIDPVEFGTGVSWRSYFQLSAARTADFFLGEPIFEKRLIKAERQLHGK